MNFFAYYNKFENLLVQNIFRFFSKSEFGKCPSSLLGHYNFISSETFYKIVVRNKYFFEEEKKAITKIKKNCPQIGEIIPKYKYKSFFNGLILLRQSALLKPIDDEEEQYQTAKNFLDIFKKHSILKSTKIDEMPNLKKGLEVIKYFADEKVFQKTILLAENFLTNNLFNMGFCHGDFHSKNLMKNNGKKYLLDLDCTRENSPQELDAIYFLTQKIIDENPSIWWNEASIILLDEIGTKLKYRDFLTNFLDINKISLFILIYFLDRIGQDLKYLNSKDELPKKDIMITLNHLICNK